MRRSPGTLLGVSKPRIAFGVSIGDRLELVSMGEDPRPLEPGTVGVVVHICDIEGFEQIGVAWENGRTLALLPGVDRWKRVMP